VVVPLLDQAVADTNQQLQPEELGADRASFPDRSWLRPLQLAMTRTRFVGSRPCVANAMFNASSTTYVTNVVAIGEQRMRRLKA